MILIFVIFEIENVAFGLEKPPIEEEDRENDVTYDTDAYLFGEKKT